MKISIQNHFLYVNGNRVAYHDTPNNGGVITPRICIMHYTADPSVEGTISWFMSTKSQVSAHLLIGRDGDIHQFVPFNLKAWHCGESSYHGVKNVNDFSIGIEFANAGLLTKKGTEYFTLNGEHNIADFVVIGGKAWQKYTDAQMEAGKAVWEALKATYALTDAVPHSFIAPIRKIDAGEAFNWPKILGTDHSQTSNNNVKETSTTVNIRILPEVSEEAHLVDYPLTQGTDVQVLFVKADWSFVKVASRGICGWVSSKYLSDVS